MQCHKCSKDAVVHLTEIIAAANGAKQAVEIHLCFIHAVEAGFISAASEPHKLSNVESVLPGLKPLASPPEENPMAIIPAPPGGLSVVRKDPTRPADSQTCPICGITWHQFKQAGLMGCPHDYIIFAARLTPLIKRAQENFTQHAGKVPHKIRHLDPGRSVALVRLRRELQQALERENYEQAANLRDQLKTLNPD